MKDRYYVNANVYKDDPWKWERYEGFTMADTARDAINIVINELKVQGCGVIRIMAAIAREEF